MVDLTVKGGMIDGGALWEINSPCRSWHLASDLLLRCQWTAYFWRRSIHQSINQSSRLIL